MPELRTRLRRAQKPQGARAWASSWLPLRLALLCPLLAFSAISAPSGAAADPSNAREYKLKAAFVYNFTKFIRWPENAPAGSDDSVVLCVLAEPFISEVVRETIAGKPVRGNPIQVLEIDSSTQADRCHLVFVSSAQRGSLSALNDFLKAGGVLVVSEASSFGEAPAMINLVVEQNKVRFEIDIGATEKAGLKISSKLLKLARASENE